MTTQELLRLYTQGQLPRRDFVQRLSLAGVSAGAALAYAQTLAPSASAAVGRLDLYPQAQYGGPIDTGDLDAAIQTLSAILDALIDFVQSALDQFGEADFADFLGGTVDVFAELQTLLAQLGSERDSLVANSGTGEALNVQPAQPGSPDDFLANLGDVLDVLVQLYAGLIGAAEASEPRQLLASLGLVKGEQAAFVRLLRGTSAFPNDLETPIDATEAQNRIEAILS